MGTTLTAGQAAINQAFVRFAREVVTHTFVKKEGNGTYDYHAQGYKIRIVKDAGFPGDVPVTIFFQDSIEVASGHLCLADQCDAKITPQLGDHLSSIASVLTGMLDRGEFAAHGGPQDKNSLVESMFDASFKSMLTKFNRLIVSPARQAHPPGKYQWPMGNYTLEVDFPESSEMACVPFTVFLTESGSLARGTFNTTTWDVTDIVCGQSLHAIGIFDAVSRMVDTNESMSPSWETSRATEPQMLLNNIADINDEWVDWFRKENPGTSYAKAVNAALTYMNTEVKKFKAIIDKYNFRP